MSERSGIVTLLSDFGLADPYVGVMKGVMLREAPELRLVDLTHAVPAQDHELAGFFAFHAFRHFPGGSVHLCVVDPGVGGARAALVVRTAGHYFVAPDNGLLSRVLEADREHETRAIDVERLGLGTPSRTFHGRDVFAPAAARLASGRTRFEDLGPPHVPFRSMASAAPEGEGHVLFVDRFGNLVSDVPASALDAPAGEVVIEIADRRLRVVGTYAEAALGECVGLVSSFGTLEVAKREGSAAQALGVGRGTTLRAVRGGSS